MRLVTFTTGNDMRVGALIGEQVIDLSGAYGVWRTDQSAESTVAAFPESVLAFLQADPPARELFTQVYAFATQQEQLSLLAQRGLVHALKQVQLLPPIARPGKIICLGLNYRRHVQEMGRQLPDYPVLFAKFANTLIGHRQPIVLPRVSQQVDYEAELALVVGKTGKDIPATEEAFTYLAGYTILNDVSVRDFQKRTVQWLQGKTFDTSGPLGPALVTLDEIHSPQSLDLTLRLNGEIMQQANTSDFIFDIPAMLAYISQIMTLEPGDIIATGTPSGVGDARKPQIFLKAGDIVQIEIAELGILENPVVAAGQQ
jgi:acylpyruvate hydrolase